MRRTSGAVLHIYSHLIYNTAHSLNFHIQSYIFSHLSNSRRESRQIYITRSLTFHIQYYTFTHLSYTVLHICSLSIHCTTHLFTFHIYNSTKSLIFHYTVLHIHSFSTHSTVHSYIRYHTSTHFPYTVLQILSLSMYSPTHLPSQYTLGGSRVKYTLSHIHALFMCSTADSPTFYIQCYRFTHISYTQY